MSSTEAAALVGAQGGGMVAGPDQGLHAPTALRTLPQFAGMSHVGSIPPTDGAESGFRSIIGMGTGMDISPGGMEWSEPAKRKRGRPRKYFAPGTTQLAIQTPGTLTTTSPRTPGTEKRPRGRPPGSGKKQQLGGASTKGISGQVFVPHIITVADGEDIARKIMSFAQVGPRVVCVMSASGAISNATLRQQSTSGGGTVTYQGRYEILSLMGSFFPTDARSGNLQRTGGLSVSLSCADGRVIGGSVAGLLLAASPIQVVVGSFMSEPAPSQPLSGNGQGPSLGLSPLASSVGRTPKNE